MAFPSVTYTFSNGSTSDATQVNQNFTDLINGFSDTTKDISVNNVTGSSSGTLTANGNVILGISSAKTLTLNASLISSIVFNAQATYDIGGSSVGLRSLYIAGTSSFTTRITSQATASWTLSLPATGGAQYQSMQTDGTGTASWAYAPAYQNITSQTGTYAASINDHVFASSSSFTITLPAVSSANKGLRITVQHNGTSLSQVYTINTSSSQTITMNGTTFSNTDINSTGLVKLVTVGEWMMFISDGTNWGVCLHGGQFTDWVDAGTMTITGTTTNPAKGTTAVDKVVWRRQGRFAEIKYNYKQTATGSGTTGSGSYEYALPTNMTIDTTFQQVSTGIAASTLADQAAALCGLGYIGENSSSNGGLMVYVYDTTHFALGAEARFGTSGWMGSTFYALNQASLGFTFTALVPIVGWLP